MIASDLKNVVSVGKQGIEIRDQKGLSALMDGLIYKAVFSDEEKKKKLFLLIKEIAKAYGAVPA